MKIHEFTLILTTEPDEEEADRLYSIFNDRTVATIAGVPQINFHRETASLEEAIGSALVNVKEAGFDVVRVEIAPNEYYRTSSVSTKMTTCVLFLGMGVFTALCAIGMLFISKHLLTLID